MKHWMTWKEVARSALVIGLLASGAWACGDDSDDDDEPTAGTGASGTGASGTGASGAGGGGSGGSSGGGSGGSGGTGGMAPPPPIMCMPASGAVMCAATMTAAGTTLMPCCDAMEGNNCGAIVDAAGTCIAKMQMGAEDASCPDAMSVLGMAVNGCCRPDGMCGLLSGTLAGCVERSRYPVAFLATVMGMPPPAPTSQACGGDADGGI